ncbi:MAG: hypothetical protein K0Q93_3321 [Nocardioidaceae bacterium]|nr:hypothetical protein [Nocardioidaceae bacterium]
MSAMSELDARLREMGTPYPDDEGDLWVMVGPDQFRYVVLSKQGAVMRLGENVTDVIRERNDAEKRLAAVSERLSYLLGYWGDGPTIPVKDVRAVLEMCHPPDQS